MDCEWEYGEFGRCTRSCGGGTKTRYPVITVQPQHGGKPCPNFVVNRDPDEEPCNQNPCPGLLPLVIAFLDSPLNSVFGKGSCIYVAMMFYSYCHFQPLQWIVSGSMVNLGSAARHVVEEQNPDTQ